MRFPAKFVKACCALLAVCMPGLSSWAQTEAISSIHQAPMVERYGKPYVMVTIDGKGPFRFVIDTGTGGDALVTPELARELGLPTVGHAMLSDPSGQGGKRAPIVLLDTLELAGVEFKGIRAVSHGFFAEAGTCDGLLGFTLFRDYLLTLDFPNRVVTLSTGSLAPDGGKSVLPSACLTVCRLPASRSMDCSRWRRNSIPAAAASSCPRSLPRVFATTLPRWCSLPGDPCRHALR